jgi:hypothetical protein
MVSRAHSSPAASQQRQSSKLRTVGGIAGEYGIIRLFSVCLHREDPVAAPKPRCPSKAVAGDDDRLPQGRPSQARRCRHDASPRPWEARQSRFRRCAPQERLAKIRRADGHVAGPISPSELSVQRSVPRAGGRTNSQGGNSRPFTARFTPPRPDEARQPSRRSAPRRSWILMCCASHISPNGIG